MKECNFFILLTTLIFLFGASAEAARLGGRMTIRPKSSVSTPRVTTPRVYSPSGNAIRRFNQNQSSQTSAPVMPIFVPPVLGTNNLIKVSDDFYLIKTGVRRTEKSVTFWTLRNKEFEQGKSAKIQLHMSCEERQFKPIAIAIYELENGKGKNVYKGRLNEEAKSINEKSLMHVLHNHLCVRPKNEQKTTPTAEPSEKLAM